MRRSLRFLLALALVLPLGFPLGARADIGASLMLQSDARERGLSYSAGRPSAALSLSWDGDSASYAGAALSRARFATQPPGTYRSSPWLQVYGGHLFKLSPEIDLDLGLRGHQFASISRYNFAESYVGLQAEQWLLRLSRAPNYYGGHQATWYLEAQRRGPVQGALWWVLHAGLLKAQGQGYVVQSNSQRWDARAGLSWSPQPGLEVQLAAVAAGQGGPTTWTGDEARRTMVLGVTWAH
jgi:hypothetical protein